MGKRRDQPSGGFQAVEFLRTEFICARIGRWSWMQLVLASGWVDLRWGCLRGGSGCSAHHVGHDGLVGESADGGCVLGWGLCAGGAAVGIAQAGCESGRLWC